MITSEQYKENYSLEIGEFVESRGGSFKASYLSWAHATRLLKERHPELSVDVVSVEHGYVILQMLNIQSGAESGKTYFPCMDNKFNAIADPSVTDLNYAVQRGTAKIIAINTGIGLKLYVGEDIPSDGHIASTQVTVGNNEPGNATDVHWTKAIVPIGFDKGKQLGEIMNPDWLIKNFKANEKFSDSIAFRKALDDCHQARSIEAIEPIDEIAEQASNDPTDPESDEVPF